MTQIRILTDIFGTQNSIPFNSNGTGWKKKEAVSK